MINNTLTIQKSGTHEIIIKKSRFVTTVSRIKNEQEAKKIIAEITDKNPKANHNCFAYVLGDHNDIQRESDNGEPSGTAGVPILEVLKNMNLRNVLVVVTRYFGGIKLGAGGLIRAYSNSASKAIEAMGVVKQTLKRAITIEVNYNQYDKLEYFLKQKKIPVEKPIYGEKIQIKIAVADDNLEDVMTSVNNLLAKKVNYKKGQQEIFEEPYQIQNKRH